jgi:hypothetical protein
MPIPLECPACSRSYQVRDEFANRTIQCKSCGESMTVPAAPPSRVKSPASRGSDLPAAPADDWAQAFGSGGNARPKSASRPSPGRSAPGSRSRRESTDDADEDVDPPVARRSLHKKSRSPLIWVVVGLSILVSAGALGIGVWFGMQRRQANTAPGPGGFPSGVPGNNGFPGQNPGQPFPSIDNPRPDFAPPDIPRPPFPVPDFPRPRAPRPPATSPPTPPQPTTGPVGPNLKEDPNRPGGFPASPGGVPQ